MMNGLGVKGKFTAVCSEKGRELWRSETRNTVMSNGLGLVIDWFRWDVYKSGSYPGFKKLDTTGMTVTTGNFTNAGNAVDGSDSSYAACSVGAAWDTNWWKIDFGEMRNVSAIRVDWSESDSGYGCDYKFQYSSDGTTWSDFAPRLRPPQEANVRGKVMFMALDAPPLGFVSCRYIRLNTLVRGTTKTLYLYELVFFEPNFAPLPPTVVKLGDGTTTPSIEQTALSGSTVFAAKAINVTEPSSNKARIVASLGPDDANGVTWTEAGAFFCPDGYKNPTMEECTMMFSRALWDVPWSKIQGQNIDVWYEIEVSNA